MRALVRLFALLLAGTAVAAQNGTLKLPATVKADGLPPISSAVVDKLRAYASFARTELRAWHPSRNEIIVSSTSGATPQLYAVTAPGARPTPFAAGVRGSIAAFAPQSTDFFIYLTDTSGNEQSQIYKFDIATRQSTRLTDGKSRHRTPTWARRSNRIAYASTARNGKDWDVYTMDVADPASAKRVGEFTGSWSVVGWSHDDKHILLLESLPGGDSVLWTHSVDAGERTAITDRNSPASWRFAQYSGDGRSIYAVSTLGSALPRVWRHTDGKWTALTKEGDAVESLGVSPDGAMMAVVFDRDSSSRLELIDTKTLKVRRSPKLPLGQVFDPREPRWNPSGSEVAVTWNTLRTFSDVFSVNAKTGAVTRWTVGDIGGVDPTTLPEPEIIRWKSFDGKMIPGVLYRPPARFNGPRPVIINIHGGPVDYERPRFQGRSNYFLNELGIAIIMPNVRGSAGFGRAFERLDDQKNREDAVKDIGALLDWIGRQKHLDPKRVMVTGSSYGGYLTYAVAMKYPERIRAAYAASAISNFVTYLETTEAQRVDERRAEYGDERDPAMREFLLAISPLTHAAKLKVPLLIAHGKNDPRVPVAQAQAMYEAAKANNVPVWLVVFEDQGHEFRPPVASDFHFYAWVTLVEKYLVN